MQANRYVILEKILKNAVLILSGLVILMPLVVVPNSYFPYIIQKTLIFRVLTELLFSFYLVLALLNPFFRPKKTLILWSVAAFFGVMLLTTLTSQSLFRSWWGNWERMFGTFNSLHYLLWFLALNGIMKRLKDWNRFLNLTLFISLVIALYALSQRLGLNFALQSGLARVNGTLGNASYLAAYLLFHLFIALLFLVEKKGLSWKIYYAMIFIFDLVVFVLTGTRGAQLALAACLPSFIVLALVLKIWRQKAVTVWLVITVIILAGVVALFAFKNSSFIKDNYWLKRMTAYSLSDSTAQTRLHSWRWGIKGFRDNLLVGVGPENYHIPFNQYFEADFYNYSGNEIWFDRAHNTLVDMAATMGIFGLLAYLGFFAAIFITLIKFKQRGYLAPKPFIVLFLLFLAYFIQNLLVFDSLNSLIVFYLLLGYLAFLSAEFLGAQGSSPQSKSSLTVTPYLSLPVIGLLFLALLFKLNLPEFRANQMVYQAYVHSKFGRYQPAVETYRQAYQITVNKVDPAILLSTSLAEMIDSNDKIAGPETMVTDFKLGVDWLDKAITLEPKNMFLYYLQAKNYSLLASLTREVKYLEKGIVFAKEAQALSPGRLQPLWVLAQIYAFGSQPETAIDYLNQAIKLNDHLLESYLYLGNIYANLNNPEKYFEQYSRLIDLGYNFTSAEQITQLLKHYQEVNDRPRQAYLEGQLVNLPK